MAVDFSELRGWHSPPQTNLQVAFETLCKSMNEGDKTLYTSATLEEMLLQVRVLDHKHKSSNRTRTFAERLQPIACTLERYGKAFDAFAQIQATPTSLIWGALRVIVEAVGNFVRYFDRLVTMVEELSDSFSLYREYEELLGRDGRFEKALGRFYYHMLALLCRAKKIFVRSLWCSFELDFSEISGILDRDKSVLRDEITLAWRTRIIKSLELQQQDCHPRGVSSSGLEASLERRQKVMEWLTATDMSSVFLRERHRRLDASGCWLSSHPQFLDWLASTDRPRLWVIGKPGSGKTVLATALIENTQKRFRLDRTCVTAFFFCSNGDEKSQSSIAVLTSLISQVLSNLDEVPAHIFTVYNAATMSGRSRISAADRPLKILMDLAATMTLNIIIDGLDESEEASIIIKDLLDLQQSVQTVRFACLSRDLFLFRGCLEGFSQIKLSSSQTKPDIDEFISKSIHELPVDDTALLEEIQTRLSSDADGMFLWVNLMIKTLKAATSVYEIKRIMASLPCGLEVTYQAILESLAHQSEERRELARRIFIWTCSARRPLHWQELQSAIATEVIDEGDCSSRGSKMPFKKAVLELCAPLIEYSADSDTFRPTHFSVCEFLFQSRTDDTKNTKTKRFMIDRLDGELEIATGCLRCLARTHGSRMEPAKDALTDYATMYWCVHLTAARFDELAWNDVLTLLSCSTKRREWISHFLFLHTTELPLQRLLNLQLKLLEWASTVSTYNLAHDATDWVQDTTYVLTNRLGDDGDSALRGTSSVCDTFAKISHFEKLMVVRDLSREYKRNGRLDQAEAWLKDALKDQRNEREGNQASATWILNSLGLIFDQQTRRDLAIRTQCEALAIQEAHHGPHHLVPIWTVNELGRMYRHVGDFNSAERSHLRALEYLRRVLQPGDLQIAWTLNTLARTYRKQGRPTDAIELHNEALEIQKAALGNQHPHVLWAMADIGRCLQDLGDLRASAELQKEVLRGRENALGPTHLDTLWAANEVALVLALLGDSTKAKALHSRAFAGQIAALGEMHPDTIWTREQIELLEDASVI